MARQTPIISISANGGTPNVSDADVSYNSIVVLENTDRVNVDKYTWNLLAKPPGPDCHAHLSAISWERTVDGGTFPDIDASATVLTTLKVELPIKATEVQSVKIPGDPTDYFSGGGWLENNGTIVHLGTSLPGGTMEVVATFAPYNPATSFVADAYGTYIVELTLNRWLKGRIGAAVRSPYLHLRLPVAGEQNEFEGWGTGVLEALVGLEDGYATVAAASGSGTVTGDLSGSLPSPTVVGLRGRAISASVPSSGQGLVWNGSAWAPTTVLSSGSTASGDLSGTYPSPTVSKLQGRTLDGTAPSPTYVLAWDGTKWTPTAPGTPAAHHLTHENGGADEISVSGLSGVLADAQNAGQLQSRAVAATAPSSGQVLSWNGSQWAPATPSGGAHTMGGTQHIADTLAAINTKVSDQNLLGTLTTFGGDVSGTYGSLTVTKLQNRNVDSAAPALSEVLTWDGSKWSPQSGGGPPSGAASGDLGGTYPSPDVVGIRGAPISGAVSPSEGWVLAWNSDGYEWMPQAQSGSGGGDGYDLIFADDSEFTETGTTPVTKKTFRVVMDGVTNQPHHWRVVIGLWVIGSDTAECTIDIGGDNIVLTTTNTSETVLKGGILITAMADTFLTANIKLRVTTGVGTAHLKYTDIYAVKDW